MDSNIVLFLAKKKISCRAVAVRKIDAIVEATKVNGGKIEHKVVVEAEGVPFQDSSQ